MPKIENIALFDLDGTLSDYDLAMFQELEKLRSPSEKPFEGQVRDAPDYIRERANLIRKSEEWWANMPRLQLGWDILETAKKLDFRVVILTQGPKRNPPSWSGKKKWIDKNLGEDTDVIITRDKGLVYGKIFVDDFPGYIERWLEWRPRSLVIMPVNKENKDYSHKNVIPYDGSNLDEVKEAIRFIKER